MATLFTLCQQALANPVTQETMFVLESLGLHLESKKTSESRTMYEGLATVALIRARWKFATVQTTHISGCSSTG